MIARAEDRLLSILIGYRQRGYGRAEYRPPGYRLCRSSSATIVIHLREERTAPADALRSVVDSAKLAEYAQRGSILCGYWLTGQELAKAVLI